MTKPIAHHEFFRRKNIFVTGACGTIGKALIKTFYSSGFEFNSIVGIDTNESELFFLDQHYREHPNSKFLLADIRDARSIGSLMAGMDIVFHCAALKHVVLGEHRPHESVATNIVGTENVIEAAILNGVEVSIFTSSDKAVNPTNVMGTSKLMGERLFTAANLTASRVKERCIFSSIRFGNVLGSSGSVVPIFSRQLHAGDPITITDHRMTRFVMTVEDAIKLLIGSAVFAQGGEVFVMKMPMLRIPDLASTMRKDYLNRHPQNVNNAETIEIGAKPGEKLYEELLSAEECARSVELESFFSVLPAFRADYEHIKYDYPGIVSDNVSDEYNSQNGPFMSESEISEMLNSAGLIGENK